MLQPYVLSDPQIMSGAMCFRGTRVTVLNFVDHIEAGYTIDGFLESFPTVQREQAVSVLVALKKLATDALSKEVAA